MADFTFGPVAVYDPVTNTVVKNGSGGKLVSSFNGPALPIWDQSDQELDAITSNEAGVATLFKANVPTGLVQFGTVAVTVFANEVAAYAVAAMAGIADLSSQLQDVAANSALPPGGTPNVDVLWRSVSGGQWAPPPAGGSGGPVSWESIQDLPTTFPPSTHKHPAGQISDSTTIGQALMTAASQQAARAAIGAGTSSSDLRLGSTADTAAPGNHSHAASTISFTPSGVITAQNLQQAVEQAAESGGGGGGSADELVVYYASGAYPTQPLSAPAGVKRRTFYGPSAYTGPTWPGVLDLYFFAALT